MRAKRILSAVVTALFFTASGLHAAMVIEDWQFQDPDGTNLSAAMNSVGTTSWNTGVNSRTEIGGGMLHRTDYSGTANHRAYADIDNLTAGRHWLVVHDLSLNWLANGTGSVDALSLGFDSAHNDGTGNYYSGMHTARWELVRSGTTVALNGITGGGGTNLTNLASWNPATVNNLDLVLELDQTVPGANDTGRYQVHWKEAGGNWNSSGYAAIANNTASVLRIGAALRLAIDGPHDSTIGEVQTMDRVFLASSNYAGQPRYASAVLSDPDLIAYYRLNETSGTVAREEKSGGLINNGVYHGSIPGDHTAGPSVADGFWISLESANTAPDFASDSARLPDFDLATFTIAGFFKNDQAASTPLFRRLFTNDQDSSHPFAIVNNRGRLAVATEPHPAGSRATDVLPAISDGEWHHLVVVRDGGNVNNVRMYIDGEQVGLTSTAVGPIGFSEGTWIGNREATNANWGWLGGLDEVAFFARAFDQDDVTALYSAAIPEPSTAGLLAFDALCLLCCRRRRRTGPVQP